MTEGGREAILHLLSGYSRDELAAIVGRLGFDPARKVRRWKDEERLRGYLADEVGRRLGRNRIFLEETAPRTDPAAGPAE